MPSSASSRAASRSRRISQLGVPAFAIVGLADRACQEAKERVRSGIASAELEWPVRRITVNLAPADLRKEGSGFDLPIALALLAASHQIPPGCLAGHAAVGELALDGRLRPVPGLARRCRGGEAKRRPSARLRGRVGRGGRARRNRADPGAASGRGGRLLPRPRRSTAARLPASSVDRSPAPPDLADVRGQERARRVLEIAAAGGHNLLLAGPPGIGKTMLARRLPGILPPLDDEAALEVTRIHSVAGVLERGGGPDPHARPSGRRTTPRRPRRSSAEDRRRDPARRRSRTTASCCSTSCRSSPRHVLEALRQPLEDGTIAVARVGGRCIFPARFQLVGTMNLCPCGGRGDAAVECSCSPQAARPLPRQAVARAARSLRSRRRAAASACRRARRRRRARALRVRDRVRRGASRDSTGEVSECRRTPSSYSVVPSSGCRCPVGAAAKVARVSRTIAALAGAKTIAAEHVAEALSYRSPSELAAMSDLALAMFAASRDAHAQRRRRARSTG